MNFRGIIIEESLEDKKILKNLNILKTTIEKTSPEDNTPWLKKWTMHTIEVTEEKAMETAERIAISLDKNHNWCVDYKNEEYHFIIFKKKIFVVDRSRKEEYEDVKRYGLKLGIPEEQLNFSSEVKI
jgi:hypothetical protein